MTPRLTLHTGPLPPREKTEPWARAFRDLQIGQYLALPCAVGKERDAWRNRLQSRRAYYERAMPGRRFTVRTLEDGTGIGVWRTQ